MDSGWLSGSLGFGLAGWVCFLLSLSVVAAAMTDLIGCALPPGGHMAVGVSIAPFSWGFNILGGCGLLWVFTLVCLCAI
jgi:hypothetical protein